MESFYGGRQGASVVIKARFKYITDQADEEGNYFDPYYGLAFESLKSEMGGDDVAAERAATALASDVMTVQLSDPSYTQVWYNEYCIIDPTNKNNANNGKIYRRTLKSFNEEDIIGSVAEYIGQIVGPAGSSPQLRGVYDTGTLQTNFENELKDFKLDDVLSYLKNDGSSATIHPEDIESEDSPILGTQPLISGTNLIPGNTQDVDNNYVQHGSYGWYHIRKNTDTEDISKVYLGFDIPYYVTEFEDGDVLSYRRTNVSITKTINTGEEPVAPFYEKYKINVPRGVPGAWIDNLRWEVTENANAYYGLNQVRYIEPSNDNSEPDSWGIPVGTEPPSIPADVTIWACDFHWIDKTGVQHDISNLYVSNYKGINNITLNDTGTLTITYTDNSTATNFSNKLVWITDALVVTGSEAGLDNYVGHLLIKFNNNTLFPPNEYNIINIQNNPYNGYIDLGLVKTIQEGLFVQSKGYEVTTVVSSDSFANIETKVHNYLNGLTGVNAPDEEKAQIVTIKKDFGTASEKVEKTIAYWNSIAKKWEILGDTVATSGGFNGGAVLDPNTTNISTESTDLVLTAQALNSSGSLNDYPPVFPREK